MKYSIFGESHGPAIGVVLEGVPPGLELDLDAVRFDLARRAPGKSPLSTARREADEPRILSGVFEGRTTGAPLCAVMENTDTRSADYARTKDLARPGHPAYAAHVRYGGVNDYPGGGDLPLGGPPPPGVAGGGGNQGLGQRGVFLGGPPLFFWRFCLSAGLTRNLSNPPAFSLLSFPFGGYAGPPAPPPGGRALAGG